MNLDPFAIANSLLSILPINLLFGGFTTVADTTSINNPYITLVPNDLALLEPLRLPVQLINLVFGTNLQTPLANALQPALQILVNIGYPDVVPPAQGGTYNRTFTDNGTPIPFLSVSTLTPAEALAVPGDVVRALITDSVLHTPS